MTHVENVAALFNVDWLAYREALLKGLLMTVKLTVAGFLGACLIGIVVALTRTSRSRPVRAVGAVYTESLRNLPFITGIFIVYFGFTGVGILLSPFTAGVLCLSLFYGAYLAEIFRAALQGISPGQTEAAYALGMTPRRVLGSIRLPQAVRLALPGTATMLVDLLKGTAVLVTIGGGELMTQATVITSDTFRPMEVYVVVGLIYMAICFPLSRLAALVEKHLAQGTAMSPLTRSLRKITRERLDEDHMSASVGRGSA